MSNLDKTQNLLKKEDSETRENVTSSNLIDMEKAWAMEIQKGNYKAFESIFHAYQGKVHLFIKKFISNSSDAEEITQETFVKIWLNRDKIDSNKSISAYIFTVAKNCLHDFLRKKLNQKKHLGSLSSEAGIDKYSPFDHTIYNETDNIINNLIDQLPPKRKEIFKMSRFQGESYRSIACKLGVSENTVDTQMRKALQFLRKNYTIFTLYFYFFY